MPPEQVIGVNIRADGAVIAQAHTTIAKHPRVRSIAQRYTSIGRTKVSTRFGGCARPDLKATRRTARYSKEVG